MSRTQPETPGRSSRQPEGDDGAAVSRDEIVSAGLQRPGIGLFQALKALRLKPFADIFHRVEAARALAQEGQERGIQRFGFHGASLIHGGKSSSPGKKSGW